MNKNITYDKTSLQIVNDSTILEPEDFAVLNGLKGELVDCFKHSQIFRTRTEMEVSVLNDVKHPTPDAKYWQAMREQNVMYRELVLLSYEYRKTQVEIKMLQRDLNEETDDLKKEMIQIDIDKKLFESKLHERTAKDRIREIKNWHEIKQDLIPQMKNGIDDVNSHQLISYTQRFVKEVLLMGDTGSPSERRNLLGLLNKGVTQSIKAGVFEQVCEGLPEQAVQKLKNDFKYLLNN